MCGSRVSILSWQQACRSPRHSWCTGEGDGPHMDLLGQGNERAGCFQNALCVLHWGMWADAWLHHVERQCWMRSQPTPPHTFLFQSRHLARRSVFSAVSLLPPSLLPACVGEHWLRLCYIGMVTAAPATGHCSLQQSWHCDGLCGVEVVLDEG